MQTVQRRQNSTRGYIFFFVQTVQTRRNSSSVYVFSSFKLCKDVKTAPVAIYLFFMQTVQIRRNSSPDCIFFVQTVQTHRNSSSDLCIFLRENCANTSKQLIYVFSSCKLCKDVKTAPVAIYIISSCKLCKDVKTAPLAIKNFFCANCANSPPSHLTMCFLRANCAYTSKQLLWLYIFSSCKLCKLSTLSSDYVFSSCKLCKHIETVHLTMYFLRANCTKTSKQLPWLYIYIFFFLVQTVQTRRNRSSD